jgi:hypothetical protein
MADCQCGSQVKSFERLGCADCGGTLCPRCAVPLESVGYCRNCAGELLGSDAVESSAPFEFRG